MNKLLAMFIIYDTRQLTLTQANNFIETNLGYINQTVRGITIRGNKRQ